MPHSNVSMKSIQFLTPILSELRGLLLVQSLLLALTWLLTPSDSGDLRVQLAWLVLLVPGWFFSASWTGRRASLPIRYAHAVISAIGIHGCVAGFGSLLQLGFRGYYVTFAAVTLVLLARRWRFLVRHGGKQRLRLPAIEWIVWIAVMVFVVAVYRVPRSVDIIQFSMQQQDMTANESLQPSLVGMEALGVREAMPRWRSQLWHLAPSLIADATSLPVEGVLRRWAPIPIAFSVFVVLIEVVRRLVGRRVPLWAVVFAVTGPVVLWYRSYNAFNYSFRLTNSFCLDKDLCLFLLIPATIYLASRWIRNVPRSFLTLMLLIPAIVKFHPMTPVYLILLIPFVVIGYDCRRELTGLRWKRQSSPSTRQLFSLLMPSSHAMAWVLICFLLFVVVVLIGDAQTAHEQISEIVRRDWDDHQTGRPLHYWVGHYASIPDHDLELDTTAWANGRLHLRSRVIWNCGLLGAMHVAWVIWLVGIWRPAGVVTHRRWLAITAVLATTWLMWFVSPAFLTWRPHYLAGFERLHWFAYVPALVAVSGAVAIIAQALSNWCIRSNSSSEAVGPSRIHPLIAWLGAMLVTGLLGYSAICFRLHRESVWTKVRFLNSLLDFELPAQIERERSYDPRLVDRDLASSRPEYLTEDDRVLFLENSGNDQFWLIKQGVFWSEPYAEAYAWRTRGDTFLEDRYFFYELLDRRSAEAISGWLEKKRVSLLVDRRPGADAYLAELNEREQLGLEKLSPGVWRRAVRTQ